MPRLSLQMVITTALLLASCGAEVVVSDSSPLAVSGRPPNLVVTSGEERLELEPWTYCWTSGTNGVCADGMPPDPLPSFESPVTELVIEYPLDWGMLATFYPEGSEYCDGQTVIQVVPGGETLAPPVATGGHFVEIFAQGDGGDAIWSFTFETTADNDRPPPHAEVYWYQDVDETDPGVSMEVNVANVAQQPDQVAMEAVVTDATGATSEFAFDTETGLDSSCWSGGIHGRADPGTTGIPGDAAPYDIEITFETDGEVWVVEPVRWPEDFIDGGNTSEWLPVEPSEG